MCAAILVECKFVQKCPVLSRPSLAVRAKMAWVGALSHATCPPTIGTMTYSTLNWDNVLQNTLRRVLTVALGPVLDTRPDRSILANRIWSILENSGVIDVSIEFQCLRGTKICWNGHMCALRHTLANLAHICHFKATESVLYGNPTGGQAVVQTIELHPPPPPVG